MRVLQTSCAALLLSGIAVFAEGENLLQNASFEEPKIEGHVDQRKGGSPTLVDQEPTSTWGHFQSREFSGAVAVGLTNELARTGKQSIYVDFKNAGKCEDAFLLSASLPIKGAERYRISMWGRLDRKRPLTLVGQQPLLRVIVVFYQADQETETGDAEYRMQRIPGTVGRVLFESEKWNEYYTEVKTPEDAAFMQVSFRWQTTGEGGEANGLIYFDDAVVDGPAGTPAPKEEPDEAPKPPEPASKAPAAPQGAK